ETAPGTFGSSVWRPRNLLHRTLRRGDLPRRPSEAVQPKHPPRHASFDGEGLLVGSGLRVARPQSLLGSQTASCGEEDHTYCAKAGTGDRDCREPQRAVRDSSAVLGGHRSSNWGSDWDTVDGL